jgi:hypothetical protein
MLLLSTGNTVGKLKSCEGNRELAIPTRRELQNRSTYHCGNDNVEACNDVDKESPFPHLMRQAWITLVIERAPAPNQEHDDGHRV